MNLRGAYVTSIPLVEDIIFTALSAVVVFALVTGVFMEPRASIAFAAPRPGPGPNPRFEVLYGAIRDGSGNPIVGATVAITSPTKAVTTVTTGADGTYWVRFKDVGGPYGVTVTYVVNGQTVTSSTVVDMEPGFTYGLNATVNSSQTFIWISLPVY